MLKYTDKELWNIGRNIASTWGAYIEGWTVNNYEQTVTFNCNEDGDRFQTTLSFDELDEYNY